MGKLDLYEIVYSTQPAVFFPGQPVTGVVNVKLNDGMTMRNLRLKFEGKAYVSITTKGGSRRLEKSHKVWMMMMIAASSIWAGVAEKPEQSKLTFKNLKNNGPPRNMQGISG